MTVESPDPGRGRPPGSWSRRLIGPFTLTHIVALLGTLLGTALIITVLTAPIDTSTPTTVPRPGASFYVIGERTEGLAVGQVAPELSGMHDGQPVTLTDLDGNPVSLAALRGRPVWVNFWASWCPPCQAETPVLREIAATYRDRDVVVLGISVQESSAADVKAYVDKYALGYRVAADLSGDIYHLYRVNALPTQFFIDPQGRIASIVLGPMDVATASAQIEAILPK